MAEGGPEEVFEFLKKNPERILESDSLETILWEKNNIRLKVAKQGKHYFAAIDGYMSQKVRAEFFKKVKSLLPSIARTIQLLCYRMDDADDVRRICRHPFPPLPFIKDMEGNRELIKSLIDCYFTESNSKKDTFDRRIRNALTLLVESDAQSNNAVAMALSVAAIEALLGERKNGITEIISTRVGVLLEPNRDLRQDAKGFTKKVYDDRSGCLHGEIIDGQNDMRIKTRHLAAGVLNAVLGRMKFMKRLDPMRPKPETPQELFEEIEKLEYKGIVPGIEECNVRAYWASKK